MTAPHGMVVTSQPLASRDGIAVLQEGGNAVDAAVTAAATLTVVEPTMTSLGGDLFALLRKGKDKTIHALNASGRSPRGASLDAMPGGVIPPDGALSVSVPGAVDGWDRLLRDHGTITLERAVSPAIEHARQGFLVTEVVARQWHDCVGLLSRDEDARRTFLVSGRAPAAGERFKNPGLAASLQRLASQGRSEFYAGGTAERIVRAVQQRGGWLDSGDLSLHTSDWVTPIRTTFRGYEVLELPPNTQGVTALEILNLLEPVVDASLGHNSVRYCHELIEATRIAFADRDAFVADPSCVPAGLVEALASKDYARERRREIRSQRAAAGYLPGGTAVRVGQPRSGGTPAATGDTVYLAAADANGNVVSLIQSLFGAFGSGVVAGDTGIVLQNRGALFCDDPSHPNHLAPGKRPFHTLIPALVLGGDAERQPWLSFGVMGGHMQAQGHAQVLINLLVFGMDVQEAGEAPRVRWTGDGVALESGFSPDTAAGLTSKGHVVLDDGAGFGGYQGIRIDPTGVLHGGSDPRKDGIALGY